MVRALASTDTARILGGAKRTGCYGFLIKGQERQPESSVSAGVKARKFAV